MPLHRYTTTQLPRTPFPHSLLSQCGRAMRKSAGPTTGRKRPRADNATLDRRQSTSHLVQCPLCRSSVHRLLINDHLNDCTGSPGFLRGLETPMQDRSGGSCSTMAAEEEELFGSHGASQSSLANEAVGVRVNCPVCHTELDNDEAWAHIESGCTIPPRVRSRAPSAPDDVPAGPPTGNGKAKVAEVARHGPALPTQPSASSSSSSAASTDVAAPVASPAPTAATTTPRPTAGAAVGVAQSSAGGWEGGDAGRCVACPACGVQVPLCELNAHLDGGCSSAAGGAGGSAEEDQASVARREEEERGEKIARLAQGMKCGICLELFDNPHSLPCQHSFCLDCILNCL